MENRTKRMIAVACAATLLLGGTMASYAATGFNSKGKISFAGSDGVNGNADDIIFDAGDLDTVYGEVSTGKDLLVDEIEDKGGTVDPAGDTPTFQEIKNGVTSVYEKGVEDGQNNVINDPESYGVSTELATNYKLLTTWNSTTWGNYNGQTPKLTDTINLAELTSDFQKLSLNNIFIVQSGFRLESIYDYKPYYCNNTYTYNQRTGVLSLNRNDGPWWVSQGLSIYVPDDISLYEEPENTIPAEKILAGQVVNGVTGTATSDADAVAANITAGKTAYVNGLKITGTGEDNEAYLNTEAGKTAIKNLGYLNMKHIASLEGTTRESVANGTGQYSETIYLYDLEAFEDTWRTLDASNFIVVTRQESRGDGNSATDPLAVNFVYRPGYVEYNNRNAEFTYYQPDLYTTATWFYGSSHSYNTSQRVRIGCDIYYIDSPLPTE